MLKLGSLFSGAGLCDLGLQWAGFKHQWFCEIDPFCRTILAKHYPNIPIYEDIKTLKGNSLPPVDVLCGGFPCQDVSEGGKRIGIDGSRSGLWYEYARLIKEIRPKYAIIENVRGLFNRGIEKVLQNLAAIGYDAEWETISARSVGAPHIRERVFIIAYPHMYKPNFKSIWTPLRRNLANNRQSKAVLPWNGIPFDRQRRETAYKAFYKPVVYRVDDGRTERLYSSEEVGVISRETAKEWKFRYKTLANAITPQQAYYVGACVLEAEGITPLPMPDFDFYKGLQNEN